MNIAQPSRKIFWRTVLLISTVLPWLSIWQSIALARRLEIDFVASRSWMGLLIGLFALGLIALLTWTLTWSSFSERTLSLIESPERWLKRSRWVSLAVLVISLVGFTVVVSIPFVKNLFGGEEGLRLLVFLYFALLGAAAAKSIWQDTPWFTALLSVVLVQTTLHLLAVNFSYVTNYPFAMGWSETSRYYYPSLFISKAIYGQGYPLPILHPTLHLLLVPPYLFDAPLWFHRFWQVTARILFLAVVALVMIRRISIKDMGAKCLVGLSFFLYLLMGPLYFHLAVPVILILIWYSSGNERRNWIILFLTSAWCGWSRVNWYPVPAIIMAVLYVLESPFKGKNLWQYLLKPALWGIVGLLTAFAFQRIYIAISGVENTAYFYTSLASDLLWYRLVPSATFPTGILPAAILLSASMWFVMYLVFRTHKGSFHPMRSFLLIAALIVLFVVGVFVSLKIGGGADLHNMDSYFVVMLIMIAYLIFAHYSNEDGSFDNPLSINWVVVALLIAMPVWSQLQSSAGIVNYDRSRTNAVLASLQYRVDQVNSLGGEILFINQRHLISMGMLSDVTLVPEYEREDLMEMAMGNNTEYLGRFRSDMENQRFSLIVVDPLRFQYLGPQRSFGEENNVWVRRVMKYILCNYREDEIFLEDNVALYVPQDGERQCPQP